MRCSFRMGDVARVKKVAVGINSRRFNYTCTSTHAEVAALNKIIGLKTRPKKLDLIVVRYTKLGLLSESRPCMHCLKRLTTSNINIRHIYYSTGNGIIVRENLHSMLNCSKTYISSGFRKKIGSIQC